MARGPRHKTRFRTLVNRFSAWDDLLTLGYPLSVVEYRLIFRAFLQIRSKVYELEK